MFQEQDKGQDYYPIDEADLDCFDTHVVFDVHYFLQFFVAFTDLPSRILDVEVDSIKDSSLFHN